MRPYRLVKPVFISLIYTLLVTVTSPCPAQYYHHGKYSNLWITSDFFGYWVENFPVGSHGHGYKLFRIDNWESTLIREKVGDFGGYSLFRPFFINDSLGFIGEGYQASLQVLKTLDSGENWEEYGGGSTLHANMFYLDSFTGYVSHYPDYGNPSFVHGYGKGNSWQSTDYRFDGNVLYFINDSTGFVTGLDTNDNHCLLRTKDYGVSWQDNFCNESIAVNDIHFFNPEYGFFVSNSGLIVRTNDGGNNWEELNSGTSQHLNCVRFYSQNEIIIVGNGGTILRSFNAGDSWQPEENNLESNLTFVTPTDTRTFIQDDEWNIYSDKAIGIATAAPHQPINIAPNPVKGIVKVTGLTENQTHLKLFNAHGVLVMEASGSSQLDMSPLENGIYFLEIETFENRSALRKIIKL